MTEAREVQKEKPKGNDRHLSFQVRLFQGMVILLLISVAAYAAFKFLRSEKKPLIFIKSEPYRFPIGCLNKRYNTGESINRICLDTNYKISRQELKKFGFDFQFRQWQIGNGGFYRIENDVYVVFCGGGLVADLVMTKDECNIRDVYYNAFYQ
jgi:hypothetical protein